MNKLTINLVTYNGAKYIPFLFDSLKKQTYKDWAINVIDNNSQDSAIKLLKKELNNLMVQNNTVEKTKLIEKKENIGFTVAHNELFQKSESKYFLILNQDTYLQPDCLEKMVKFLDKNKEVFVVSPRLMKWDFTKGINGFTNIIDSLGLKVLRSRRVVEIGAGDVWNDKNKESEVFGVSGTCAMFRKSAIEEVLYKNNELFDSSYFMYKEDVDLAYRLQQRDSKVFVLSDAVCYHDRSGKAGKNLSDKTAIKNKKSQSELIKYYSYKNHLATLYKNFYWQNIFLDLPWIKWYEFKKFIYLLLFDRNILRGLWELWKSRKDIWQKRKQIKNFRKVDWKQFRKKMFI
jgi:GT2 family glycosyltransferase